MEQLHQILDGMLDTPWAYLVLLVWTIFEGETCLIVAGAFAADGKPNIALCILAAFAGSLAGDQMWFHIGRRKGTSLLAKRPVWQQKAQRVFDILERHSTWLILGFRFLYGLRNVTPFAIGMTSVNSRRFLLLNAIGAAVWAIAFGLGGYLFGTAMQTFFDNPRHRAWAILVVACVIFTIWLARGIVKSARQRHQKRLAATQPQPPLSSPTQPPPKD